MTTTTKTTEKTQTTKGTAIPSPEEMKVAYECHTLAQILYRQIVAKRPWLFQATFPPVPFVPGAGATPWGRT